MHISGPPDTYAQAAQTLDDYEAANLGYSPEGASLAAATERVLAARLPAPLRPFANRITALCLSDELCAAIGESESTTLRYRARLAATDDTRAALAASLEEHRAIDLRRGITHAGPHRDELVLELGGREMREFASAGQQRTGAIALRMVEAATLRESCGSKPVLLLDDPFAELDARRSAAILALLADSGFGQTFLCVPKAEEIPAELSRVERWGIRAGVIKQ